MTGLNLRLRLGMQPQGSSGGSGPIDEDAIGSAAGISTAAAIGRAIVRAAASAAGLAAVAGIGAATFAAAGAAAGTGAATGAGTAIIAAAGSATGAGAAAGVGVPIATGAGASSGLSTAAAAGVAADPNFSSVKLLCGFDGANNATSAPDESSIGRTLTFNGNAKLDTGQAKFGASSLTLDGTGDYVSAADSADWNFGSGQFTVELFVRHATGFGTNEGYLGQWGATVAEQSWFFFLSAGSLLFRIHDSGGSNRDTSVAWTPTVNTWYHLAVDRDASNKVRIYRDGAMIASSTVTQTFADGTGIFGIGVVPGFIGTYDLQGWIDEARVTKGVARYASDSGFTVPTAAYPRA